MYYEQSRRWSKTELQSMVPLDLIFSHLSLLLCLKFGVLVHLKPNGWGIQYHAAPKKHYLLRFATFTASSWSVQCSNLITHPATVTLKYWYIWNKNTICVLCFPSLSKIELEPFITRLRQSSESGARSCDNKINPLAVRSDLIQFKINTDQDIFR